VAQLPPELHLAINFPPQEGASQSYVISKEEWWVNTPEQRVDLVEARFKMLLMRLMRGGVADYITKEDR
jgi:hypothetical protein